MKLILASNNKHKLEEIKSILKNTHTVESLADHQITEEIPETGSTLQENALIKAKYVFDKTNIACFADDTGLEVEALNNEPGVYSARYAGEPSDSEKNMTLLLEKLKGNNNRKAQFRTVIALIIDNETYFFEGIIRGSIAEVKSGNNGFGYDPIFIPIGYNCSFADLPAETKNKISHRALATQKLIDFLKSI